MQNYIVMQNYDQSKYYPLKSGGGGGGSPTINQKSPD